jgi:hypothetical protein
MQGIMQGIMQQTSASASASNFFNILLVYGLGVYINICTRSGCILYCTLLHRTVLYCSPCLIKLFFSSLSPSLSVCLYPTEHSGLHYITLHCTFPLHCSGIGGVNSSFHVGPRINVTLLGWIHLPKNALTRAKFRSRPSPKVNPRTHWRARQRQSGVCI